jgi:2-polyprenyl-3-methyl-5-hydroxy-6-metoxy-1,4-benzoquinol methylase
MKKLNNIECFLCGNKGKLISLRPDYSDANNYLCEVCGLVFIPREKASMKTYYKDDGYFKKSPNLSLRKAFASKSLLISNAEKRIKEATKNQAVNFNNKKILDVGCAYGEVLYYLKKKYNSKVFGIEASKETAAMGERMFNIKIYPLLLEEFMTKDKFDIILSSHTLEHVDNPHIFLTKIRKLLKPQGYLYIEVPNILKPTGGFRLNKFLYSEHLQTFSIYNLIKLLRDNEFSLLSYSDEGFLKVWLRIGREESIIIEKITAKYIENFLKDYKNNYSLKDYFNVYQHKFQYLMKLAFCKTLDILQ